MKNLLKYSSQRNTEKNSKIMNTNGPCVGVVEVC